MSALAWVAALVGLQVAYGWPAAALAALASGFVFVHTATTAHRQEQIVHQHTASETHPGVIRRRLARMMQLQLIRSVEPVGDPDAPRAYQLVTAGGDVVMVTRHDMPTYLSGLAHGAHAATAGQ